MNYNKKIPGGALRCFKFDMQLLKDMVLQYILIIAAFVLVWKYTNMMSPLTAVLLFTSIIPMAMTIQRYTTYFSQTIGFSLSRRSLINGGLLMKPVYMLFSALLCTLTALIDEMPMEKASLMIFYGIFTSLFMASLGDLLGSLIQRFNRIGYLLYISLYMLVIIPLGIVYGIMSARGVAIGNLLGPKAMMLITTASVGASAVINIVVRCILKRVAVR